MNDNSGDETEPKMVPVQQAEPTEEEIVRTLQAQVAMLLDAFKKLFVPEMKISFIARHPSEPATFSFMTEDTKEELINFLERVEQPKPLVRVPANDTAN